jgi:hypothetical protein
MRKSDELDPLNQDFLSLGELNKENALTSYKTREIKVGFGMLILRDAL